MVDSSRPADAAPNERPSVVAQVADLPELEPGPPSAAKGTLQQLLDVSVGMTVELGRATLSIDEILRLGPGSVVGLDSAVAEPVELFVQGVLFARGEVVVIEDRFAIRICEIIDAKQSTKR
ncbi:MAG: flagellar motor switch protein FliN [Planctomycetes bacterium]|nr:flagellar motor switch protein FliN [Planctomycetota bacterium]